MRALSFIPLFLFSSVLSAANATASNNQSAYELVPQQNSLARMMKMVPVSNLLQDLSSEQIIECSFAYQIMGLEASAGDSPQKPVVASSAYKFGKATYDMAYKTMTGSQPWEVELIEISGGEIVKAIDSGSNKVADFSSERFELSKRWCVDQLEQRYSKEMTDKK